MKAKYVRKSKILKVLGLVILLMGTSATLVCTVSGCHHHRGK